MIQLDDVNRNKLAFRNQGQLAPFVCYLVSKIGNFAINITEQKNFLSNCSKQLVTPVNLTRNFFLTNYLISSIGSELPKLKTAFYESHFPHCDIRIQLMVLTSSFQLDRTIWQCSFQRIEQMILFVI